MGQSSKSGGSGGGGGVVCPSTAISIGGCASGTALISLDASGPGGGGGAGDGEPERGTWTGRFDFLLSLLGYSVGLGNVWRFPYLCYNNGGGAFLIPFTIMLVIAGLPLMFMELSFGQYAALGPVAVYRRFCPLFRGLGTGMILVSAIVMLYYNLIIAWTIFYMFASFGTKLPWQNCEPAWSTKYCFSYAQADQCEATNGTYYLRTCHNATSALENNITALALTALKRPPAEEYFNNFVLGLSKGIEETGSIKLSLAACLFLAWAIVFLCLCKGVQSSGKVVYFTALFPYVVLVILFIRGVTLPGASTGILFYLTPDWKQLANAQVWGDAAVQIFFALSPAWGGLITLSSYNKFSNNCYKDSLIVAFCNIATSFFAGLVIFSIIGFLAHELNVDVEKVVDQGAGLAFIVYPEVVTRLPISPVWAVLFFVMLLTLGLDSQFALMETVTTAILDRFPNLRQYKIWVVLSVAIFGYIGGLGFTTNSGMYWLQLMDKYAANWSVLLIAISECILIAWIYGSQRFLNDIQGMIGKRSWFWNFFWGIMWRYITPATLLFILFFNWVEYKPAKYGHYVYPLWADTVGWIIGLLPVLVIFLVAFQEIWKAPKQLSFRERIKLLLQPTAEWGPAGRPCVNLHAERYQSQNYDGVTNTQILIEKEPTSPKQKEAAKKPKPLTLDVDVDVESLPLATVNKRPGPGITKSMGKPSGDTKNQQAPAKNGTHKSPTTEISPSKQPLIPPEKAETDKSAAKKDGVATTKVLAAGTLSSGRECTTMSTFAGGGEKLSTTVNLAATTKPTPAAIVACPATTAAPSIPEKTLPQGQLVLASSGATVTTSVKVTFSNGANVKTTPGATIALGSANGKATSAATVSNGSTGANVTPVPKATPSATVASGSTLSKVAPSPIVATGSLNTKATPAAIVASGSSNTKVTPGGVFNSKGTMPAAKVAGGDLNTTATPAAKVAALNEKTQSSAPEKAADKSASIKPTIASTATATAVKPTYSIAGTKDKSAANIAAAMAPVKSTATATPPATTSVAAPKVNTDSGSKPTAPLSTFKPEAKPAATTSSNKGNTSAINTKAGKTKGKEMSPTKASVKPIKTGTTSPTKGAINTKSMPASGNKSTATTSPATGSKKAATSSATTATTGKNTATTSGSQAKTKANSSAAATKK
ncbi:hypothetical protein KR067_006105 [Drosophila pandora]|nr:hypothetical protein KR067_006105 [Drosophila pandora]